MKRINGYIKSGFGIAVASILFTACQKVINIDLNSVSPQTVVQANFTDMAIRDTVVLTQTVNFSDPNYFPAIAGAFVTIGDNAGNLDTLFEYPVGTYTSAKLTGVPGRTYTLNIANANGKSYSSTCTMPQPVNIDTLTVTKSPFGRNSLVVNVVFQDPGGGTNYYKFIKKINSTVSTRIYLTDNQLQSGQKITFPLVGENDSLKAGDSVRVYLETIDPNVFKYYSSLNNASGGGGANVAPANPASNINNGALGYFSAYAVTTKSIIVP